MQDFSTEEVYCVMYIHICICVHIYLCIKLDRYVSGFQLNLKFWDVWNYPAFTHKPSTEKVLELCSEQLTHGSLFPDP